jgi:hypothetical protein
MPRAFSPNTARWSGAGMSRRAWACQSA